MRKTMELAAVAGEFAGTAAECYGQRAPSPQLGQTSYWLLDVVHKLGSHDCLQKILEVMLLSARENAAGRSFIVHREDGLLESALNALALKNSELEKELQDVSAKCAEYEGWASSSHQRSLEMEDLIQTSHSKAEGAEKKTVELELLLSPLCPSLKHPIQCLFCQSFFQPIVVFLAEQSFSASFVTLFAILASSIATFTVAEGISSSASCSAFVCIFSFASDSISVWLTFPSKCSCCCWGSSCFFLDEIVGVTAILFAAAYDRRRLALRRELDAGD